MNANCITQAGIEAIGQQFFCLATFSGGKECYLKFHGLLFISFDPDRAEGIAG